MILLFDVLLSVSHAELGREFQDEMLSYMPEPHRAMVRDFAEKWKTTTTVRDLALARARAGERALLTAYDESVHALRDLRRFHLMTVASYLDRTNTGTGASTWRMLLQSTLDSTESSMAACPF